jgi:hypothetical protein
MDSVSIRVITEDFARLFFTPVTPAAIEKVHPTR